MLAPANPYLITGPATISFSGGRTSGMMVHEIWAAHGGALPADIHVVFANTGKEREETLRFVYECSTRWGVRVRWIEWRKTPAGFEEVGYNSASRNGEPFAALIAGKSYLPNWQARFCTQYLKVEAMTRFLLSEGFEKGSYQEVIGLRHDEGMRLMKMFERNDQFNRQCVAPLAKAKVTERDVMRFWAGQPFDLDLMPGEGNCDLCFLKGRGLRKALIRARPDSAKWWIEQEERSGAWFDRRDRYAVLAKEVADQPDLFISPDHYADEHDVECGLLCQP